MTLDPSAAVAAHVRDQLASSSWIREMFEKGHRLRAERGADAVHDLSLGNPNAAPPQAFFDALQTVASDPRPELHRYLPNAGFAKTRHAVAAMLSASYASEFDATGIVLTSGAAGALHVSLQTLLNPDDEVVVPTPYFPEYRAYIANARGVLVPVGSHPDFSLDLDALLDAITPRTKALILNSPNNPTGVVYSRDALTELARRLQERCGDQQPFILCDDVYHRVAFDGVVTSPVDLFPRGIVTSSYSKDLSVPGERLGYIALPTTHPDRSALLPALAMLNRTLGFVNANAFMQRVIAHCATACCDQSTYRRNRDVLCEGLADIGYRFTRPGGAMYVFPQTPTADDVAFVERLTEFGVLAVPGQGFAAPGHMRLSFCVAPETIDRALPGLRAAFENA